MISIFWSPSWPSGSASWLRGDIHWKAFSHYGHGWEHVDEWSTVRGSVRGNQSVSAPLIRVSLLRCAGFPCACPWPLSAEPEEPKQTERERQYRSYDRSSISDKGNVGILHPLLHTFITQLCTGLSLIPCGVSVDRDDIICKGFQRITAHTVKQRHTQKGKKDIKIHDSLWKTRSSNVDSTYDHLFLVCQKLFNCWTSIFQTLSDVSVQVIQPDPLIAMFSVPGEDSPLRGANRKMAVFIMLLPCRLIWENVAPFPWLCRL